MRQVVTTSTGGIGALKVEQRPDPVANPGEVIVRVRAAGLNFADILARQGPISRRAADSLRDGL